ncbi:MAG TPA: porin [Chitinophagales bacterium]|nr:porin [Chitinophagales bacterium]
MKKIIAILFLITCFISRSNAQSDTALLNVNYVFGETPQDNYLQVGHYMQLKGLIQGGFLWSDAEIIPDAFYLRRIRLDITGEIFNNFSYRLQLDLINAFHILNAEVEYKIDPLLSLHFGASKIPYCYDNFYSPYTLLTISRALLDENLAARSSDFYGNQFGRDLGFWITGKYNHNSNRPLMEYTLGIYNGAGLAVTDNNSEKDIAATLRISPVKNVWLSGRFYSGTGETIAYPNVATKRNRYGADVSYKHNKYLLEAEYLYGMDSNDSMSRIDRNGWYITAGYMLIENKLQTVVRLDTFNDNINLDMDGVNRYVIAGSWFFTKNSRIQFEYDLTHNQTVPTKTHSINIQLLAGF